MERLACHLGMVLQKRISKRRDDGHLDLGKYGEGDSDEDITASPLLFPTSNKPHWHVDILRGYHYDLHHNDGESVMPVMPIVEFTHDNPNSGHVLIRIQGLPMHNLELVSEPSRQAVTLVFDACFRDE